MFSTDGLTFANSGTSKFRCLGDKQGQVQVREGDKQGQRKTNGDWSSFLAVGPVSWRLVQFLGGAVLGGLGGEVSAFIKTANAEPNVVTALQLSDESPALY